MITKLHGRRGHSPLDFTALGTVCEEIDMLCPRNADNEPQPERMLQGQEAPASLTAEVSAALFALAAAHPRLTDVHHIRLRRNEEGLFLHYHCRCSPDDTVEHIHDEIDRVEAGLKERFPDIRRVIAHAEPLGAE